MVILAGKCQRDSSGLEILPGARKSVVTWISQDWGDRETGSKLCSGPTDKD